MHRDIHNLFALIAVQSFQCICGHQFALPPSPPPPKKKIKHTQISGEDDVISIFVYVLSFKRCAIWWTFECWDSLLWTVVDNIWS